MNKFMKTLACKDMGVNCGYVAKAETEEEVIEMMNEHAKKSHRDKIEEMAKSMSQEEMEKMMREKIKEE